MPVLSCPLVVTVPSRFWPSLLFVNVYLHLVTCSLFCTHILPNKIKYIGLGIVTSEVPQWF